MEMVLEKRESGLRRSRPEAREGGLRAVRLRAVAQQLDGATLGNSVTMQEIVDEVNAVRNERHEKNRI